MNTHVLENAHSMTFDVLGLVTLFTRKVECKPLKRHIIFDGVNELNLDRGSRNRTKHDFTLLAFFTP